MLAKLDSIPADFFIVDLEDGVPPAQKDAAREILRDAVKREQLPAGRWALRVNAVESTAFEQDRCLVSELAPSAIVLPKAEDPALVGRLARQWTADGTLTLLMVETAAGVGRVRELANADPSVCGLLYGAADLRLSLGARPGGERRWERHAMSEILLAARMVGCSAIDAVTFRFRDDALLEHEALIARELGFDGKSCVHPAQIETIHRVFSSTPEEIDWAEGVQKAWHDEGGDRAGVVVMDGEMIEALHVDVAQRILSRRP